MRDTTSGQARAHPRRQAWACWAAGALSVAALAAAGAGCTAPGQSTVPWNAPQAWEGTPLLPVPGAQP
jgi:hypothetical protein